MKEPLKKGADRRCSPARGSPASQEGDRQQGHPIGTIPNSTNGLLQEPALLLLTSSPAQPVPQLLFGTELKAQEGPFSIQQAQCISPHPPLPLFFSWMLLFLFFSAHSRGMPLSLAGGLCTTGLQERLVSTMAATISSISTAASAFLCCRWRMHRGKSRETSC